MASSGTETKTESQPPFVLTYSQNQSLAKAISFQSENTLIPDFVFVKELSPKELFKSIQIEKIGRVNVPLSEKVSLD